MSIPNEALQKVNSPAPAKNSGVYSLVYSMLTYRMNSSSKSSRPASSPPSSRSASLRRKSQLSREMFGCWS
ncbi:uncharacterized protein LDX57_000403 [Aspergillus melleus]|uniref:uncharacterized protein n=1 Tax=Aspergillus melleus TaxID=138277 RepID=UPI001E8DBA37|nr:uncharacterized protein LDX57_000403 [Aspergillus melleus]KAH8422649.1 hypothetical protein LDX57_000403 [Aspergillus melleus]